MLTAFDEEEEPAQVQWNGKHSGHHGEIACISSQSYKMLNSGEGGFALTDDDVLAAKLIMVIGAYEKCVLPLPHPLTLTPSDCGGGGATVTLINRLGDSCRRIAGLLQASKRAF